MNLFFEYQNKIYKFLKLLEKKKKINVPFEITRFSIELPPRNQNGDISCNAALILAKSNNTTSIDFAIYRLKYCKYGRREFQM